LAVVYSLLKSIADCRQKSLSWNSGSTWSHSAAFSVLLSSWQNLFKLHCCHSLYS